FHVTYYSFQDPIGPVTLLYTDMIFPAAAAKTIYFGSGMFYLLIFWLLLGLSYIPFPGDITAENYLFFYSGGLILLTTLAKKNLEMVQKEKINTWSSIPDLIVLVVGSGYLVADGGLKIQRKLCALGRAGGGGGGLRSGTDYAHVDDSFHWNLTQSGHLARMVWGKFICTR
ncbi:hypothetical protein ACJX0J_019665, partial [Zea mays]